MWPDAIDLARVHFLEVEGPLAGNRPFKVNANEMQKYDEMGVIRCVTARLAGKLIGYATFSIMPDVESMDLVFANQGAIYASPLHAKLNLCSKMLDFAIAGLKALGAKYVLLHHRLLGRGAKMGALLRRKKAVPIKHEYYLWIGD